MQIREHLDKCKISPITQSGFRASHSCSTALLKVTDVILSATDKNKLTALILFLFLYFIVLFILMSWRSSAIAALPLNQDTYTQTITQRTFPTALPSAVAETRTQEWYSDYPCYLSHSSV